MMVKQVIVVRIDLKIRKGKMVASGSHASLGSFFEAQRIAKNDVIMHDTLRQWLDDRNEFRKIVCGVSSEEELVNLYEQVRDANLPAYLVEDLGLTEFNGIRTKTAACFGPCEDWIIDSFTKGLPLL